MTGARRAPEMAKLLAGGAGLFAGLSFLGTAPLTAVLVMLGAMSYMLFPAASLCGAEVRGADRRCRNGNAPRAAGKEREA